MTTLAYFVKNGDDNEPLRYSLRTVAENLPHDRVLIVGGKPSWVTGVDFVPGNRHGNKWRNVFDNVRIACDHADDMIVMNDDFFVLHPLTDLPSWHRGPLTEHIARCRGAGPWKRSLRSTLQFFRERGLRDPLSYENHVPVAMDAAKLAEVLDEAKRWCRNGTVEPQWRTLYGNYWQVPAIRHPDCKLNKLETPWDDAWPFMSTSDGTFKTHEKCKAMKARFSEPSPYEEV